MRYATFGLICAVVLFAQGVVPLQADAPETETAEDPLTLSESEAVQQALSANLSLRARRLTLAAEEEKAGLAWNELIPSISASAGLSRRNEEVEPPPPAGPYRTSASYSLSARLSVPGGLFADIEAGKAGVTASQYSYEETEAEIERKVRNLYYSLILNRERVEVGERSLETAQENLSRTRADYENGRVNYLTLKQAELSVERTRHQLSQSRAALKDSRATFNDLLDIGAGTEVELDGDLPVPGSEDNATRSSDELPQFNLDGQDDVAAYEARINAQEARLTSATRSRWLPSLSVEASYAPTTSDPFNPDNEPLYGEWSDSGSVSVSLSFALDAILPVSKQSVAQNTAAAELESLRLQRQDAAEAARREYDSLLRSAESALSAVESQQLNLELAREVEELTREAYDQGTTDFVSFLEAQTDVEEARLALIEEAYNLESHLIDLEYASGTADTEGVSK